MPKPKPRRAVTDEPYTADEVVMMVSTFRTGAQNTPRQTVALDDLKRAAVNAILRMNKEDKERNIRSQRKDRHAR